jgi:hypothetical protein
LKRRAKFISPLRVEEVGRGHSLDFHTVSITTGSFSMCATHDEAVGLLRSGT